VVASLLLCRVIAKHGALLLAGGGPITTDLIKDFSDLCGGTKAKIIILPQTLSMPKGGESIFMLLQKSGFTNLYVASNSEKALLEDRLNHAAGILIPDGDQALFVQRFGLAWCQRVFPKLIDQGVNWFGNGTGAMLAGDRMFYGDKIGEGLSLFDGLVDSHYFSQHHELRLRNAYFSCRLQFGFGLDVGEWVVVRDNLIEKKVGVPQVFLRE
jgi:cyanophycinase-like exopeptidase